MARGRYVIPVIMGRAGNEMFMLRGNVRQDLGIALVKLVGERAVLPKEEQVIADFIASGKLSGRPNRIKEVIVVSEDNPEGMSGKEAALIHGYISNILPGAFKAKEMKDWYLFEKPNELTPLKLARYSLNLLQVHEKNLLIGWLKEVKTDHTQKSFDPYR